MKPRPVVTLLTDFGSSDPYVGMMKGVIAGICPDANIVDLTHEVPPHDIRTGAFFLERAIRYFPEGTVHVAVVDPGVGTARPKIAVASGGHFFVGPDNGLFGWAATRPSAVLLSRRSYFLPRVSNTFHGRDVFAPVAAHLAGGVPLARFGPETRGIVKLASSKPKKVKHGFVGEIICVDRFGNLITNLEPEHWQSIPRAGLSAGAFRSTKLSTSYEGVKEGEVGILFGGYGLLEIAARQASAAARLGLAPGDPVRLAPAEFIHKDLHKTIHR